MNRKLHTNAMHSTMHKHTITCKHCGEEHIGRSQFSSALAQENALDREYYCGQRRQQHGDPVAVEVEA